MTPGKLKELADALNSQDNRATSDPIFVVEQKRRTWGMESGYSDDYAWVDIQSGDFEAIEPGDPAREDAPSWDEAEEAYHGGDDMGPYRKVYYEEHWAFVQPFFTEKGAQAFINNQSHNLGKTRIYVHSAYHNREWKEIRAMLMGASDED